MIIEIAVSRVQFKCNENWFVQKDDLAKGASLAVILANLWLKEYEHALNLEIPELTTPANNCKKCAPNTTKKVPKGQKR